MSKHYYERTPNIPDTFPLQHYYLPPELVDSSKQLAIGIDSGVSNCAFCSLELITQDGFLNDFEVNDFHFFDKELNQFACVDDKYFYIAQKYFDLYSKCNVQMVTFELLSLNTIKESEVLKGVLRAQKTTDIVSFICRILFHRYNAVSPRAVKHALTGNGSASKSEMQQAAYELTGRQFPELLSNDHLADAFGMAFYYFSSKVKEEINLHHAPVPEKYAHMTWLWK